MAHGFLQVLWLTVLSWLQLKLVSGQGGAGPLGSISDYYDNAFGNPFLGYWKNPGSRNPYGTVQSVSGPGTYDPHNNPYQFNPLLADRPGPVAPSYAYDRVPNVFEQPGAGFGGNYGQMGGGAPYYSPMMGRGGYGMGGMGYGGIGGMGYGGMGGLGYGGGYGGMGVDSRTPADRALQDLLPSTYAYKPFYP